jgi:hypothetical protein
MEMNELAFMGRITAGLTHEMKNILAVIKEASGLMDDILSMSPQGQFPHQERFHRAVSTIREQVARGVDLSSRLNRIAHSSEAASQSVDLNDAVQQLVVLAGRFAKFKSVSLKAVPMEGSPAVNAAPLLLQMTLFWAAETCWNLMLKGGELSLCVERKGDCPAVKFSFDGCAGEGPEPSRDSELSGRLVELQEVMTRLGGRVEWDSSGLTLIFSAVN